MNQSNYKGIDDGIFIDIKEIIWRLIEQWKCILVFVVVVALLLSSVNYYMNVKAEKEFLSMNPDDFMSELEPDQQELVASTYRQKKAKDDLMKYIEDSLLMKQDAYNLNVLKMSLLIKSDKSINKQLVASFDEGLLSSEVIDLLRSAWGEDYSYNQVQELISLENSVSINIETEVDSNIIKVGIILPEGIESDITKNAFSEGVKKVSEDLTKSIGDHTAELISSEVRVVKDADLDTEQSDVYMQVSTLTTQIKTQSNSFSKEQEAVYEKLLRYDDLQNSEGEAVTSSVRLFSKRLIALGIIGAGMVYVFIYFVWFILKNTVKSANSLKDFTGARIIGEWFDTSKRTAFKELKRDRLLFKVHHKGHLNMESEVKKIADSVSDSMDNADKRSVAIVTSASLGDTFRQFVDNITKSLKDLNVDSVTKEISVSEGISLSEKELRNTSGILLVVDGYNTSIKDIKEVYEKSAVCEIPVIGAAYIG